MTVDSVALCRRRPTPDEILAALVRACPLLRVRPGESLLTLCDDAGVDRLHLDGPRLVQVPGEAQRLLGVDAPAPVWWVEARSLGTDHSSATAVRTVAHAIVAITGGTAWTSN